MATSTVYDIRLRYMLEDKASKGLKGMNRNLEKTAKSSGLLAGGMKTMMALGAGGFGMRHASKALIGFNSQMEQSKIQIQGMLTLGGKMSTEMANSKATKLFADLQFKAKASAGTTKDMVDMASMIARPVLAAGLGMKDLGNFTQQAVVASKAFGMEAGTAARDIEAALMGRIGTMDRFSRSILEPLGYVGEAGRKAFSELGDAARAAKIKEALSSPAIMEMAKQQEQSFDGVLSTFQDGLQMALGRVGKPLFAALTEEIKQWAVWMDRNKATLDKMGQSIGSGLVKGFKVVKGVLGFMVDHASTLLLVAKAWAAIKIGQGAAGMVGGIGNMMGVGGKGMGNMLGKLGLGKAGTVVAGFGSKLSAAAGPIGMFVGGIGLMVTGIHAFNDWMNAEREADLKKKATEKAEALGQVSGVNALSAGMKAGRWDDFSILMEQMALDQEKNTKSVNDAKAAGLKGADADYFGKMTPDQIRDAQTAVEGLPERQAFYKEAAQMMDAIGARNEFGTLKGGVDSSGKGPMIDQLEEAGKDYMGVRDGTGGHAGGAAGTVVVDSLRTMNSELSRIADGADREAAWTKMLLGTYVESPTAQAQKNLDAMNQPEGAANKPKINVTINRIEVASDDPDRFVFQLSETVKKLSRAPAQAASSQRQGG